MTNKVFDTPEETTQETRIEYVRCHVCPLANICRHEHRNSSHTLEHQHYRNQKEMLWRINRIAESTRNCPLRKLLGETLH